ncbi:YiaA/YiaB family inner membrane protein [Laspinema olomoucense]|uniref:YiaA/YiaB family inner membrane protein n=1 Tax=Laspinema olomoucense TaxID=3231600 RepID=UPI0021BB673E|nr:YiaA/YiaB family inner membrane protein [Laspinema sp. D3d]MCT7970646.1 hypothetical protein [Laspinema sp. D3d]
MHKVPSQQHTTAWVIQVWASFVIALAATGVGIVNLPVTNWVKGYIPHSAGKIGELGIF